MVSKKDPEAAHLQHGRMRHTACLAQPAESASLCQACAAKASCYLMLTARASAWQAQAHSRACACRPAPRSAGNRTFLISMTSSCWKREASSTVHGTGFSRLRSTANERYSPTSCGVCASLCARRPCSARGAGQRAARAWRALATPMRTYVCGCACYYRLRGVLVTQHPNEPRSAPTTRQKPDKVPVKPDCCLRSGQA